MARRRLRWRAYQGRIDPRRLVFIDETWAKTNMAPLRGWCRKGRRLLAKVPHGHWKTLTFVAALPCDRIGAPCVIDGPINGESFLAYVKQSWCRHSRRVTSSSWTIWVRTKAVRYATPSVRLARTVCCCRPIRPT